jgi:hypothetical protein
MFTELPEFPIWLWFSKWPPKWRKIDLARISAKIDIQGKHDVTSSSMTSKITTELHFQKGQGWTRHCPSICSQLGFRTFGALLIFCILASHEELFTCNIDTLHTSIQIQSPLGQNIMYWNTSYTYINTTTGLSYCQIL